MIIITTLVFVVGIVVGSTNLNAYKDLPEPPETGSLALPDVKAVSAAEGQTDVDGTSDIDSEPAFDDIEFEDFDSDM